MCLSHTLMTFTIFLSASLILPYNKFSEQERHHILSHPLTCPPSLHLGTVVMQPFSSNTPLLLRGSVQHTSCGEDQKEDTPIPEGHQCLVVDSSVTHSVRAPQT